MIGAIIMMVPVVDNIFWPIWIPTVIAVLATALILLFPRHVQTIWGRIYLHKVIIPRTTTTAATATTTHDNAGDDETKFRGAVSGLFVYPGAYVSGWLHLL